MRISKCSSAVPAPQLIPKIYTHEELFTTAPEGVYRWASASGYISDSKDRTLVIKSTWTSDLRCVLFLSNTTNIIQPRIRHSSDNYIRVDDAEVCLEIKEPK